MRGKFSDWGIRRPKSAECFGVVGVDDEDVGEGVAGEVTGEGEETGYSAGSGNKGNRPSGTVDRYCLAGLPVYGSGGWFASGKDRWIALNSSIS